MNARRFVTSALLALGLAGSFVHASDKPNPASIPGPGEPTLAEVRRLTERFRDVNVALAGGYIRDPFDMCETAEMMRRPAALGAMGIHFFWPDRSRLQVLSGEMAEWSMAHDWKSDLFARKTTHERNATCLRAVCSVLLSRGLGHEPKLKASETCCPLNRKLPEEPLRKDEGKQDHDAACPVGPPRLGTFQPGDRIERDPHCGHQGNVGCRRRNKPLHDQCNHRR